MSSVLPRVGRRRGRRRFLAEGTRAAVAGTREAEDLRNERLAVVEIAQMIHVGINLEREANGLSRLAWDDDLAFLATAHSLDMVERGYYAHRTPEGLGPTDRLHALGFSCRNSYSYGVAENINAEIWNGSVPEVAAEAVGTWMSSAGHRMNVLGRRYHSTGIGVWFGYWEGWRAVYMTQVFC